MFRVESLLIEIAANVHSSRLFKLTLRSFNDQCPQFIIFFIN